MRTPCSPQGSIPSAKGSIPASKVSKPPSKTSRTSKKPLPGWIPQEEKKAPSPSNKEGIAHRVSIESSQGDGFPEGPPAKDPTDTTGDGRASIISPPKNVQPKESTRREKEGRSLERKKGSSPKVKERKKESTHAPKLRARSRKSASPKRSKNKKRLRSVSTQSDSSTSSSASTVPRKHKKRRSDTTATLSKEMYSSLKGRSRFSHVSKGQFAEAAKLFAKFGFSSWKTISKLDDETRKFLRQDLRKDGRTAKELALINDIFPHYENDRRSVRSSGRDKRETKFEEIVTPQVMKRWSADFKRLSGFVAPEQDMANVFSKEFAEAAKKDPPYIPFVVPKLHERPWMVPLGSHERAAKFWKESNSHKAKDHVQQVNLQSWLLYLLRFIFAGDLTDSWGSFGGLQAQFSHLSIVLHLAVVETAAFAIAYDMELRTKIQRMARKRDSTADFAKLLSEENEEIKRYLKESLGKGKAMVTQVPYNLRRPQPNVAVNLPPSKGYKGDQPHQKGKGTQNGQYAIPKVLGKGFRPKGQYGKNSK